MGFAWMCNTVWMMACAREAGGFDRATRSVAKAQIDVLLAIIRRNRETAFGRTHRFSAIDSPRAFQEQVPLSRYEDYAESIGRIANGERGVLIDEPVELLEPTSGTTCGERLVPYTASLRRQFQRAVAAWIFDLFRNRPQLLYGRAYWSISPAMRSSRRTEGGIPIGFEDDADYLRTAERWMLKRLLVVPAEVARSNSMEAFRYATLRYLLAADDLTLISVWSPTFLTALLGPLDIWQDRLCFELGRQWQTRRRAAELKEIFASSLETAEKLKRIWPRLALVSCWADAGASRYLPELQKLFPHVEIQPKGLLATEGCVSFPLIGHSGGALALRSHFFEFQELDAPHNLRLSHELTIGGCYRVVLTTAGGLYRYELRDEVEVVGFKNECPLLRFLGKSDCVSDLVGEKLAEPHVQTVLDRFFAKNGLSPTFAMLVPVVDGPPRYRLYLESNASDQNTSPLKTLAADLDSGLDENPHYAYARQAGQLAPAEVAWLDCQKVSGWDIYERQCLARGMRAGNIKPMALDVWTGWPAAFEAR